MDALALMAAAAHSDTAARKPNGQPSDKKTGARHGVDRSTAHRWRNGAGSPLKAAIAYIAELDPHEAMRAVATVKVRGIMQRLRDLPTAEVVRLYWIARDHECGYEADDRHHDSAPSKWSARALATERDLGSDALKAACERIFDERNTPDSEVLAGRAAPLGAR